MNPGGDAAEAARRGSRDELSLQLLHARNELLARLARDETAPALRLAARAGWFQEYWTSRHLQRQRGEDAEAGAPRLAGIEPGVVLWIDEAAAAPDAEALRHYLAQTLELTLELLARAASDDRGLYVYRLALQHEDRIAEQLGNELVEFGAPPRPVRDAIGIPAQRWQLGSPRGGFVPHNERWAHEIEVSEFEIDAQCVNWAQFAEFAEDGGYDRRELWDETGWAWLQREGRRAPRGVEQFVGGVLRLRRGAVQRAPTTQAAQHLSRHEAQAWCRWAGRRLPAEAEWELAAQLAVRRGFAWGDTLEWVAGSARLWPAAGAMAPGTLDALSGDAPRGVLRGALRGCTPATAARWRHPRARRFAAPEEDTMPVGFRSCAL